jgi:hypothetical protein
MSLFVNSTPAVSNVVIKSRTVRSYGTRAWRSKSAIDFSETPEARANSPCDHPRSPRAARHCRPNRLFSTIAPGVTVWNLSNTRNVSDRTVNVQPLAATALR